MKIARNMTASALITAALLVAALGRSTCISTGCANGCQDGHPHRPAARNPMNHSGRHSNDAIDSCANPAVVVPGTPDPTWETAAIPPATNGSGNPPVELERLDAVPEPSALTLTAVGILGAGLLNGRRGCTKRPHRQGPRGSARRRHGFFPRAESSTVSLPPTQEACR